MDASWSRIRLNAQRGAKTLRGIRSDFKKEARLITGLLIL